MCEVANMWKLLKPLISIAVTMMMKIRMHEDSVTNAETNEQFRIHPSCATHSSVIVAIGN
ncbi:hypothetical protein Pmar_PMAR015924 [Perkinsus marinus ATCC 50983]|uniref:Uncharacterized protein n=1 Tax=Perkinsus marinus (strain ATCC 50983 / TXsc) TaxID=423536 RepID=C5L439_PERM5|nr:hypothetical protein Pmar_PMAR015924 [Perkinsus marinus ATCC 50983]EER08505.1 hypothetical protein Pmar_PMAR015924 [Perkinsus marinus ATCC 50983]|eukprot:XP_002776689.1 hypothetical protein Pmar_PMAR015924 [Perkinsus marinus ATCC 50983]